jgi:xanthine dehydrogenase accessory factor
VKQFSGHYLGSVIYEGAASSDTGIPCNIEGHTLDRVFRAPCDGVLRNKVDIGDIVSPGQILCEVEGILVRSQIAGVVRGILKDGLTVEQGLKLGDIDHRGVVDYNYIVSDKMRNIAGG